MFWLFRCNGDPMIRKLFQKFCQLCCLCFCQYFKHLPRQFLCKSAAIGNTYRVMQVFHHQLLVTVFKFQVSAMTSCRFFRKYSCSCVLSTPFTVSADSSQFLEHPGQFFFVSFIVIFPPLLLQGFPFFAMSFRKPRRHRHRLPPQRSNIFYSNSKAPV